MKTRFFSLSALAVAAIALFGCDKTTVEIVNANGVPFEFIASEITKTSNDGVHTIWTAGDQVSLFHAVAGGDSYISDGAFTAAASEASTYFTGTLASELTADNYDWYAIYPYNKNIGTPANTGTKGYVTIGSTASGKQTQTGNDSMAHIGGANYPVAGKALNVDKASAPVIPMSHLTSLIAVRVTNGNEDPITVSQIVFTGTEDIVGTYFIDFVSSPVVYTGSGVSYVSNAATLQVTSGTTIAKNTSATFYLAVKPFTAPKGGDLALAVTADNGEQTKEIALESAFTFAAGQMNTLNFTYNKAGGGPSLQYTLDGTVTGGSNGYATDSSITQNEIDWSATGNTTISPWRIGGKSLSGVDRVICSATAISANISSVEVESGTSTLSAVNSLTISVHNSAEDAASGANAIATKTESSSANIISKTVTLTKADETSWAGKYYRIVYNVNAGGSNQYIQFKAAKFYGVAAL